MLLHTLRIVIQTVNNIGKFPRIFLHKIFHINFRFQLNRKTMRNQIHTHGGYLLRDLRHFQNHRICRDTDYLLTLLWLRSNRLWNCNIRLRLHFCYHSSKHCKLGYTISHNTKPYTEIIITIQFLFPITKRSRTQESQTKPNHRR